MKSLAWALVPSVLSTGLALGAVPLSSVKRVSNQPTVANKFIVEVDTLANIPNKRDLSAHEFLYESLRKRDVAFEVDKEYDSQGLFVGAALTLNNANDAAALINTPGIKAIRPVRKFARPVPVKNQPVKGPKDPNVPPDTQSTHILTGVDKLHNQGLFGKGIKIGSIDSGLDYNHPSLGGGFGAGHKVSGGWDFVGDDYTGENEPKPDADPMDCGGHGTHVAGIIGADPGNEFNTTGVAYQASLNAYRVFGCDGSVTDDIIIDALLRGVRDQQDILTLSLGGSDGWSESSSSVVASRIAASGKIVTIAAGNEGASGSWYTSSPGNGIDVISVASLDNTVVPLQTANVAGVEHGPIIYFQTFPLKLAGSYPIYVLSKDTTIPNDACDPLPESTPDLSKYVVIVRRGTCTFVTKINNIAAKGAKAALIYDNGNGFTAVSVGDFPAALIQAADGEFLVQQFFAGAPVLLSFPQDNGSVSFPNPDGGLISSFSTYGPTNDFYFKPSIAAPGGNILSTVPLNQGAWGVKSGTSMATPFVAGSAALYLQAKGRSAALSKGIRTVFETNAQRVASSHTDGDPLQTVTQQGAGLINVYDAIYSTTLITPGQLILNDTAHFKGQHTFSVKNTGKTPKKYTLTHVPAGTAVTVEPGTIFPSKGRVPLTTASVKVDLSHKTFTLSAGQALPITARFTLPKGDAKTFPVYSGFIEIASGSEKQHVTYLGLGASLKDKQVLDNTDYFFDSPVPAILNAAGESQTAPTDYTFKGEDFPTLLYRLAFGTPSFRVDLVDSNIKLTGTLNPRGFFKGPWFSFPRPNKGGSFAKVKTIGPLSELSFIPRHDEGQDTGYGTFAITPTFANGTGIPNGQYRVLVRTLRVTGDHTKEEDYDAWLSPIIGIKA
ncbi:hypothetical protein H0H81_007638 [Sphagnurus paluster]|uniref:Subtilisin-like protease n=1 Tax=Sphagnurus paluster TaxID=117069 RepID=A0A9P7G1A9_9AGAR|nr:hypothetical protein H0H81_007638 [Sphagnurus paluster]